MNKTIIFHIDVNSAFLSWEAVYRIKELKEELDLRTIPSAVGGDIQSRHGIVLAKSIPAKKYNIYTSEPIVSALKKCPQLVVVPSRFSIYEKYSQALRNLFHLYTPVVEPLSIDEAFLDMTGIVSDSEEAIALAHHMKNRIKSELGFTVNIGISSNKLLAKMASDFLKPDNVHTLFPEQIKDKMWPLPIRELYSVGKATEKKLLELGIRTIGELAKTDISILKAHFKKQGEVLHNYANGNDSSYVSSEEHINKGYGNSITLPQDISDYETAHLILLSLSETVCTRLRSHNVLAIQISVEIKDCNFISSSRQKKLVSPTAATMEIYETVTILFRELWNGHTPIRLLGVRAGLVTDDDSRQLNMFDMNSFEKLSKLDNTIDSIRKKFGDNSVIRASLLNSNIEPGHKK